LQAQLFYPFMALKSRRLFSLEMSASAGVIGYGFRFFFGLIVTKLLICRT